LTSKKIHPQRVCEPQLAGIRPLEAASETIEWGRLSALVRIEIYSNGEYTETAFNLISRVPFGPEFS
jgi:hypothetical protein